MPQQETKSQTREIHKTIANQLQMRKSIDSQQNHDGDIIKENGKDKQAALPKEEQQVN